MIAKYIVLCNIISAASDIILLICIQESLLISKKVIVLLHTLSAYNSLLFRYKVYSSDPRECLCTRWRYAETYENFSIDPAPCQKNPIKNKIVIPNCQPLLLGEIYTEIKAWQLKFALSDLYFYENLHWNKSVTAKVSLENLVNQALKQNI